MKLVTWNTQWCCGLDGVVSPQRIVEGARAMGDFDVLCLQEIASGYGAMPGGPGDQPAELSALLPGFQLFFGAAVDEFDPEGRRQRFGNVIATRLPVSRVQHHPLPWPADPDVTSMPRMCTVLTLTSPQTRAPARDDHAPRVLLVEAAHGAGKGPARIARRGLRTGRSAAEGRLRGPLPAQAAYEGSHPLRRLQHGRIGPGARDAARAPAGCVAAGARQCPHAPTFRLFDRRYGPDPVSYDFVFVSDGLAPRVRRIEVDLVTRASDHQPVFVEFGD